MVFSSLEMILKLQFCAVRHARSMLQSKSSYVFPYKAAHSTYYITICIKFKVRRIIHRSNNISALLINKVMKLMIILENLLEESGMLVLLLVFQALVFRVFLK